MTTIAHALSQEIARRGCTTRVHYDPEVPVAVCLIDSITITTVAVAPDGER